MDGATRGSKTDVAEFDWPSEARACAQQREEVEATAAVAAEATGDLLLRRRSQQ